MHNSGNDCKSAWSYPRRQTIHEVCNRIGLSYRSSQHILVDELNMRWIAAKFVPRLLNNDWQDHRVQVCTELQKAFRHDPNFLSRIITGDESWLYNDDPKTKQQSSQWKTLSSPWPEKACQVCSNIKSMVFFFYLFIFFFFYTLLYFTLLLRNCP